MQKFNEKDYYIVRARGAGVFAGNITEKNGQEITMTNVRRLHYWDGAASLSQMANEGVKKPQNCRFSVTVNEITVLEAIEVLKCTDEAEQNIRNVGIWRV